MRIKRNNGRKYAAACQRHLMRNRDTSQHNDTTNNNSRIGAFKWRIKLAEDVILPSLGAKEGGREEGGGGGGGEGRKETIRGWIVMDG